MLFAGHHFYISSELISLSSRCLQDKQTNVCLSQDPWFLGIQPDLTGADACTASVPWLSHFCLPHLHVIMPSVSQTKIIVSPWPCPHIVCRPPYICSGRSLWLKCFPIFPYQSPILPLSSSSNTISSMKLKKIKKLFIFGCAGSSLLCIAFL